MESAQRRYRKPTRKSLSSDIESETAYCDESRTGSEELAFSSEQSQSAAEFECALKGSEQISARTRLAYVLLKAEIGNAVHSIRASNAQFATERRSLQACAIESIYASARATIEFMDGVNTGGPTDIAATQIGHNLREREVLNDEVMQFLAAAQNMISILTAPLSGPVVDCSNASVCPTAPCQTRNVVERLKTLTERQRRVLELIADGLPNKIIAYKLGLCETTVKAHVSEILRKLCVYSRARAIVLLANIDLASIDY